MPTKITMESYGYLLSVNHINVGLKLDSQIFTEDSFQDDLQGSE